MQSNAATAVATVGILFMIIVAMVSMMPPARPVPSTATGYFVPLQPSMSGHGNPLAPEVAVVPAQIQPGQQL